MYAKKQGSLYRDLKEWSIGNLKEFPWRFTGDPYKIFISEFLLRRTTRTAVNRIFEDFIRKYPSFEALLFEETLDLDLKELGLNKQRSKQIKRAAAYVVEQFDGELPRTRGELIKIPGIGLYSANAISCFAFGVNTPIVDSNVMRILKRHSGLTNPREVWSFLAKEIDGNESIHFNYALLDLGGNICKPLNPLCGICPLKKNCNFNLDG